MSEKRRRRQVQEFGPSSSTNIRYQICGDLSSLSIRLGDRNVTDKNDDGSVQERDFGQNDVTIHSDYVYGEAYFDLAVVRFEPAVRTTLGVRPICLPKRPSLDENEFMDDLVRVTGSFRNSNIHQAIIDILY